MCLVALLRSANRSRRRRLVTRGLVSAKWTKRRSIAAVTLAAIDHFTSNSRDALSRAPVTLLRGPPSGSREYLQEGPLLVVVGV